VIVDAVPLDARQFAAQYEALRSHVIGTAGDGAQREPGVGLGLLLREGMPGWLNAIAAVIRAALAQPIMTVPPPPPAAPTAGRGFASPWLSNVQRQDLTALLTNLVLSTRRIEHASSREGSCR
jgi:hypothetical protein